MPIRISTAVGSPPAPTGPGMSATFSLYGGEGEGEERRPLVPVLDRQAPLLSVDCRVSRVEGRGERAVEGEHGSTEYRTAQDSTAQDSPQDSTQYRTVRRGRARQGRREGRGTVGGAWENGSVGIQGVSTCRTCRACRTGRTGRGRMDGDEGSMRMLMLMLMLMLADAG
jgi:hypothetical protein